MRSAEVGSSPRGRGKPSDCREDCADDGLIPAWAGKTRSRHPWPRSCPAHPRVGGENQGFYQSVTPEEGSSPRGRGKPDQQRRGLDPHRLIPAWAGKTEPSSARVSPRAAHPRVGGENSSARIAPSAGGGSSPRGRGKPTPPPPSAPAPRLIPAWAGKTLSDQSDSRRARAHPRVGGENPVGMPGWPVATGSSPRGRGKPVCAACPRRRRGLIPAWAGKTIPASSQPSTPPAHPRVGGENSSVWVLSTR